MTQRPHSTGRISRLLRGAALTAAPLLIYGCGQGGDQSTPTAQPGEVVATSTADAAQAQTAAVVDESSAPDVETVIPVPTAAPTVSATDAAPLNDAATIASLIQRGNGIQRIRHGDGWAWMQDGKIVRTASADGKQVAYFKDGSTSPFLLQKDDREYAYSGGKVVHAYDKGRPQAVDSHDRDTATQLAHKARDDRDDAAKVAARNPLHHTDNRPPAPAPSSSRDHREPSHSDENGPSKQGRDTHSPLPPTHETGGTHTTHQTRPSPSPTPTHRGSRLDSDRRSPHESPTPD